MNKYFACIFEIPSDDDYSISMIDPCVLDHATFHIESEADDLKTGIGLIGETLVRAGHRRDSIIDEDTREATILALRERANKLESEIWREKDNKHREESKAREPQVCNHGKLVKVDDIGPMSSGYYYHVMADGKGGWKPANDGTNYCDDWPNKDKK